ncbi:interactor of HORMAD1 protein 1 [Rana temporaria]|uniref:interactor of HORMAD1 protein 1 n=1 Tax=Rana temporaria TaxID=8407 RepID=UPI001AAE01B7|nr:interactor of HORMAD1 protein 1 [Rana temporaria]XP_040214525.1 interactor of HORMAD1 protein 1 [Rana temporaria]
MNLNVWNIKDMFSIPPGAGAYKSSNRNAASSDHSSLTDSQFLFSSQFCPESTQAGSGDYKSQANYQRNSNPNSQEVPTEQSVLQKYQTKPPLCCTDGKERGPFQTFGKANSKSILVQFEESKRKAKEKYESEQLNQVIFQVHETIQELKMSLSHMEENTNLKCKSLLDSLDATSKAMQENIAFYHESMQKMISTKCSCRQVLLDLENKITLKDAELTDLKSNVQLLATSVDAMKSQQCEKHLDLSEKLTRLSDSIKSSEDKILSQIHNLNYVSKPAQHFKENATQTSPTSVQNLPAEEHISSQFRTTGTCLDVSNLSHSKVQNTCDGISNGFPSQHGENLSLIGLKGVTTRSSARSLGSTENSGVALESPENHPRSNVDSRRVHFSDTADVCRPQQFYHDDRCVPVEQDHLHQRTEQHNGKENKLTAFRCKKTKRSANKRWGNSKNRRGFSIKNTTQIISRAVAGNSQDESKNEPVTHKRDNSVRQRENCFTLYSERCESSLPVTPVPVRKAKKKNSLKCTKLSPRQTVKQNAKEDATDELRDSVSKTEDYPEDSDLLIWDSKPLYCDTDCKNNMAWFPPSSPPLNNSTNINIQKEQQDLVSLFFDSSDDSD